MTDRPIRDNGDLADAFLNLHFPDDWARREVYDDALEIDEADRHHVYDAIDATKLDKLTDRTLDLVANIVSSIINAGSERDAVNENEELWNMLRAEFAGWTNLPPADIPPADPNRTWD